MDGVFGLFEIALIGVYFLAILFGGWWTSRKQKGVEDFYVGGRSIPWPAVLLSITATEISALTFLGVPGAGFEGDLSYLQFGVGSLLARFIVAFLFLGAFYRLQCVSIYQFLGDRFGPASHKTGAVFFLITRINASAIRLSLAAGGLALFFEIPVWVSVLVFTGIALVYTASGGIRAVVWTDCIQVVVFIGGGIAVFTYLVGDLGWGDFWSRASNEGKLQVFHWTPGEGSSWFGDWNLFYLACLNGLVMTTAALGCDQDLTQRMLTCRTVGRARWSVILSGFLGIPVAALFLLVGVALYFWMGSEGIAIPDGVGANNVFAWFIAEVAPSGLSALLFVGILATAMSSLDSALNALSSSVTFDLLGERFRKSVWFSRIGIVIFGVLLAEIAILLDGYEKSLVFLGFKIAGITYGSLLGIFSLGLLVRYPRGSDQGNLLAMVIGAIGSGALLLAIETESIRLGWTWVPILNTVFTFAFAFFWGGRALNGDTNEKELK